jgi:hypothetical protein
VFASVPAQAGMMRDDVPSSEYEAHSQDTMFDSVGWLGMLGPSGDVEHWGSAVLIDPHWILLAGHEVFAYDNTGLQFGLGSNVLTDPGEIRTVSATFVFPGYTGGWGGSLDDIALGYLADPILDVTPAERFRGTDEVGTHVNIAGYGLPGTPSGWLGEHDGQQRAGENIIDGIGYSIFGFGPNYLLADFGSLVGTRSLALEFGATDGDSGGGWFNDAGELVALNAFQWSNYRDTGAIRVSEYNTWIDETIAVPEPTTWVMLLTLLPCLLLVQRFRQLRA